MKITACSNHICNDRPLPPAPTWPATTEGASGAGVSIARGLTRSILLGVLAALIFLPSPARACSACMGGADTPIAPAMNGAIFLMLGLVGLMLSSVAGFIFYLARRTRTLQADFMREGKQHA